jgi:hypothetical protein
MTFETSEVEAYRPSLAQTGGLEEVFEQKKTKGAKLGLKGLF